MQGIDVKCSLVLREQHVHFVLIKSHVSFIGFENIISPNALLGSFIQTRSITYYMFLLNND